MTKHLLNKTLQVAQEDERIALYYGRGQIRDEPVVALARDVSGGSKTFSEALDEALSDYLKNGGDLAPASISASTPNSTLGWRRSCAMPALTSRLRVRPARLG
jgi:hypothetical protein